MSLVIGGSIVHAFYHSIWIGIVDANITEDVETKYTSLIYG